MYTFNLVWRAPAVRIPRLLHELEDFEGTRLFHFFFMGDFLSGENAATEGSLHLPENGDLAVHVGRLPCGELLKHLRATFGLIALRSGYRSREVNDFGSARNIGCASNEGDFYSFAPPRGRLTKPGHENFEGGYAAEYKSFPELMPAAPWSGR